MKIKSSYGLLFVFLILSACGNNTIADNEDRLDLLRSDGIDAKEREKQETRFARLTEKNKNALDVLAAYDNDPDFGGQISNLDELLNRALARNSDIARAGQQINRADAQRLNAIFGYLPQITYTLNSNTIDQQVIRSDNAVFQTGAASYGSTDSTFEISQPIIDMSRIFGIRIARSVRTRAEVDYIATVQRVMYEVFDTYVQALQADTASKSIRRRENVLRRQLTAERDRNREGLARETGARGLEIQLSELGIRSARRTVESAQYLSELSLLTGSRVEAVSETSIPRSVAGTERRISANQAIESAMERNPIVLASLISATEADLRNKQARTADFAPILVAFARMVDEERENSRFGGGSETSDTVMGLRLVVPIFNSKGNGYQNLETRVDLKDSVVQYLNERRRIETDIFATHRRMENLAQATTRAQSSLRASQALERQERNLIESGESQDYLAAAYQARTLEARSQVSDLRFEYLRAWARFSYLSGQNLKDAR